MCIQNISNILGLDACNSIECDCFHAHGGVCGYIEVIGGGGGGGWRL